MDEEAVLKEELAGLVLAYPDEARSLSENYDIFELGMRVFCLESIPIYDVYTNLPPLFDASRHFRHYITLFDNTPVQHIFFFYWANSCRESAPLGQFVMGVRYYYTRFRSVEEEAAGLLKIREALQELRAAEKDIHVASKKLFHQYRKEVYRLQSLWDEIASIGKGLAAPNIKPLVGKNLSTYEEYCENVWDVASGIFRIIAVTQEGARLRQKMASHVPISSHTDMVHNGFFPPYVEQVAEVALEVIRRIAQSPDRC